MKRLIYSMAIAFTAFLMAGCNINSSTFNIHDKLSTSAGSAITLSGSLSLSSSSRSIMEARGVDTRAAVSTYKLYCVTFEDNPKSASGNASSTGSFSLQMDGARNTPFGCFVQQISDSAVIATMVFQNPTQAGMSGGTQQQGQITLTGNSDIGTVTIDTATGTATVDITKIKLQNSNDSSVVDTSTVSADKLFDFTGSWNMGPFTGTLPSGYLPIPACCAPGDPDCHGGGPCVNPDGTGAFNIFMKRIQGYEWKYNGSDQNTTDWTTGITDTSKRVFGVMVWSSEGSFNTCGKAMGFTESEAKRFGRIDFNGFVDGTNLKYVYDAVSKDPNGNLLYAFNWTNGPVDVTMNDGSVQTKTILDGWKDQSATAQYPYWAQTVANEVFEDSNGNGWYDQQEHLKMDSNGNFLMVFITMVKIFRIGMEMVYGMVVKNIMMGLLHIRIIIIMENMMPVNLLTQ